MDLYFFKIIPMPAGIDDLAFFCHQINKGRQHTQAEEDVEYGKDFSSRSRRHQIPVANCSQGDHTEIERIRDAPTLS